jgi:hypothetical protein
MLDIFFIIVLMVVLRAIMIKHGTWRPGGTFAWAMVCLILFAFVRIPIYLALYGLRFPYDATQAAQIWSGITAITVWSAAFYYRFPGCLIHRRRAAYTKVNKTLDTK